MFFGFALEPRDAPAQWIGPTSASVYPSELLPEMQGLLAALADIETAYEIARERLEQGPGAEDEKRRSLAALRADWQRDREPIARRLAQLQEQLTAPRHNPESLPNKQAA